MQAPEQRRAGGKRQKRTHKILNEASGGAERTAWMSAFILPLRILSFFGAIPPLPPLPPLQAMWGLAATRCEIATGAVPTSSAEALPSMARASKSSFIGAEERVRVPPGGPTKGVCGAERTTEVKREVADPKVSQKAALPRHTGLIVRVQLSYPPKELCGSTARPATAGRPGGITWGESR